MYDRLLVPTDGSDGATAAFHHAAALADQSGAVLHVIHAVDPSIVPPEFGGEDLLEALQTSAQSVVADLRERGDAQGLAVETAVVTGAPAEAITAYARHHDIDLVVMGTHGRTGLDRWLLGSVSERVVRTSPVPVMTVPTPETGD